jgi:predicted GNAT superfamily acetyltransferase
MAAGQEPLTTSPGDEEPAIEMRVLTSIEEFRQTLEVQRGVWGFSDTDLVPPRIQSVARYIGGLVLGAFDGDRMVGFSLSFPGLKEDGRGYWHSHMTGVLKPYQNRRIGRQIKLRQREEAIHARVDLVEWMFDPLEIRNSHFNIERLGVIVRRYLPNQYGITSSPLHGALPTDRLVAEWHVQSPRVRTLVDRDESLEKEVETNIAIPEEIGELRSRDPEAAAKIQEQVREEFQRLLDQGLAVIGYRRNADGGLFELGFLEAQPLGCGIEPE